MEIKKASYLYEDYPKVYNNYKAEKSLPIYLQLRQKQLDYIVNIFSKAVESKL